MPPFKDLLPLTAELPTFPAALALLDLLSVEIMFKKEKFLTQNVVMGSSALRV